MTNSISYIEANGFTVKGRYIYKHSQRTRRKEVCGILNEGSFYMFSDNVYPFKPGVNYFDNKALVDVSELKKYVRSEIKKERKDFNISFEDYNNTSSNKSNLVEYYNSECRKYLARPFQNFYDVKSYNGFTSFPFIDYNGSFITAQLIKYDNVGKRIKFGYSTTWLHSHKQAKKELGLNTEDKYRVKISCFFGEHYLKDSNNPIAIVEAPKTAVILKMFYPNIDWIATAGESGLFNKDLSVLEGRNVILYADCNTTQWKEFAVKYGYSISNVLERNNCEAGSDLADYIFNSSHSAYTDIHSELYAISQSEFSFEYNTDLLELNFKNSNSRIEYFTAVPLYYKGQKVHMKQDNSFGVKKHFQDKNFEIYKKKYNVINAQLDWHKQKVLKGGKLRGFNEKEFIEALHECYTILKYLNKENVDVNGVFSVLLDTLIADSNFSFNRKYVMERLLPIWQNKEQNLMQFVKRRNWKYKGSVRLTRSDFITELNNSRFRAKLKTYLKRFKALIDSGEYIPAEALFNNRMVSNRGLNKLNDMRKEWNKKVLGITTKKQLENTMKIISCTKNVTTTYNLNIYSGYKTCTKHINSLKQKHGWSNQMIADSLGLDRRYIAKFLQFKSDTKARKRIAKEVEDLLTDLAQVEPIRTLDKNGKKRITDFKVIKQKKEIQITPATLEEAFNKTSEFIKPIKELAS